MIHSIQTIKWVQNGFTLGYYNNQPVFVHGALPEEEVQIQLLKKNQNHAFGIVQKIIHKNKDRIDSDCEIFPFCGGCSFRHVSYQKELEIKINLLKEYTSLLTFIESNSYTLFASIDKNYRNQIKIHVNKGKIGFYKIFTNEIVELPDYGCRNISEELNQYIKNIRNLESRKDIKIFYIQDKIFRNENFFININPSIQWELSTDCFLQVNRFLFYDWLNWIKKEFLDLLQKPKSFVLELFCGTGIISANLIEYLNYIEGYESNPISINFAKKNYKKYKIKNQFYIKDLYKNEININKNFDIIIINPPRKGIGKKLLRTLKNFSIPIIYSSCNPATLNRDLIELQKSGYKIKQLAIFDFFPRTPHLEIGISLVK